MVIVGTGAAASLVGMSCGTHSDTHPDRAHQFGSRRDQDRCDGKGAGSNPPAHRRLMWKPKAFWQRLVPIAGLYAWVIAAGDAVRLGTRRRGRLRIGPSRDTKHHDFVFANPLLNDRWCRTNDTTSILFQ